MLAEIDVWTVGLAIVQGVLTLVVGIAVGFIGWALKRLVDSNDADHRDIDEKLSKLTDALSAEKDSRVACATHHTAELSEVREGRPRREEIIAQYGALSQKISGLSEQLAAVAARLEERTR